MWTGENCVVRHAALHMAEKDPCLHGSSWKQAVGEKTMLADSA